MMIDHFAHNKGKHALQLGLPQQRRQGGARQFTLHRRLVATLLILGPLMSGGCPAFEGGASTDAPGTSSETDTTADTVGTTADTASTSTDGAVTTSTATTDAPTEGTTTAPDIGCTAGKTNVDDCCCFREVDDGSSGTHLQNDCPVPKAICGDLGYDLDSKQFNDSNAITCSIEALRDNKVGSILWYESNWHDAWSTELFIQGDGTVFVIRRWGNDIGEGTDWAGQMLLELPEYFDACLALGLDQDRYDCLKGFDRGVPEVCADSNHAMNHDGCRVQGQDCTCQNTGWAGYCTTGPLKDGLYCSCD